MKRLLAAAVLLLGSVGVAKAQGTASTDGTDPANGSAEIKTASIPKVTSANSVASTDLFFLPPVKPFTATGTPVMATALALPFETADPASPPPNPKFLYTTTDRPRWELALGVDWLRFRSSIFNASAVGVKTSISYFTNEWFAIEANVSADFAPQIFDREHVKTVVYGAGPKIAWRADRWEPWVHGIFGGAHEMPQTRGNSKNAFSIQAGGGVDYHFNPRFSGRLEANYVRTTFFSQSQNNFELAAGVVFHF
jgi:opacity protein-like surface antigen